MDLTDRPAELAFVCALLAVAATAWASTIVRVAGMSGMGLWSYPTDVGVYLGTWIPMMAAMMLPSIVPTALRYERAVRTHRGPRIALGRGGIFVGGYLAIWAAAGLVVYALLELGGALPAGGAGRYLAAGVLVVAAAYQLVPPKRACLQRLRVPDGGLGALRAGLEAGGWCLGCCWALMASLAALGLMSLTWMIAIWALVMAERLLPSRLATLAVAVVLAVLAIAVLTGVGE